MNEIQKEINNAYMILSTAKVRGDLVDVVAACRAALRSAYKLAGQEEAAPTESQTGAPTEAQHSGLCEDAKGEAEA